MFKKKILLFIKTHKRKRRWIYDINAELTEVIKKNQKLIYTIISYFPSFQSKEDLFQVGCIGLIKAYKNYNRNFKVKFSSYAYMYIMGEIKKYIRDDKSFKVSREISILNYKINKAIILLSQKLMREPSKKEIAEFLELDVHYIDEAINSLMPILSLDEQINSDETFSLYEVIPSKNGNYDELIMLNDSISKLSESEKRLIELRYFEDRTQTEIAEYFNTNQTGISRQEQKILEKLRNSLSA